MSRGPAVDVLAAVEEAEALLAARDPCGAADQLRWVLEVSRDPDMLRRVHALAWSALARSRGLVATVVWAPLVHTAALRIAAATAVYEAERNVVWADGDAVAAGRLEATDDELVLGGHRRIRYRDVVRARLGRGHERVAGKATLVLESSGGQARIGFRDTRLLAALVDLLG